MTDADDGGVAPRSVRTGFCTITGAGGGADCSGLTVTWAGFGATGAEVTDGIARGTGATACDGTVTIGRSCGTSDGVAGTNGGAVGTSVSRLGAGVAGAVACDWVQV